MREDDTAKAKSLQERMMGRGLAPGGLLAPKGLSSPVLCGSAGDFALGRTGGREI